MFLLPFGDTEKLICTTRTALAATAAHLQWPDDVIFVSIHHFLHICRSGGQQQILHMTALLRISGYKIGHWWDRPLKCFILWSLHGPRRMRSALTDLSADQASQYDSRRLVSKCTDT